VYKDGTADRTVPDRHGGTFPHVPLRGSLLPGQQSAADEHTRKPTPHGQGPVEHNTLEGLFPSVAVAVAVATGTLLCAVDYPS
jgi:hypothetical protein